MKGTIIERFEAKYITEPNTGCWLWTSVTSKYGRYGTMWVDGSVVGAHRISYQLFCGSIPDGANVLHRCDMPCCVNPEHLFIGTHETNMQDKAQKGRAPKGAKHHNAKITAEIADRIRADDRPYAYISATFGISFANISRIKHGKLWQHAP